MSDQPKREIVYWTCTPDAEELEWESLDDAIEAHLLGIAEGKEPATIKVYGWARVVVTADDFPSPLELIMDRLSEDDEDGMIGESVPEEKITPAMREAEKTFLEVVAREFKPWSCEIVETKVINVAVWRSIVKESK